MPIIIFIMGAKAYCQHDEEIFIFDHFMGITKESKSTNINNTKIIFNIPFKIKNVQLLNTLKYKNFKFSFDDKIAINTKDIESINSISYGLSLKYPITANWFLKSYADISMTATHLNPDGKLLITGGIAIYRHNVKSTTEIGIGNYTFLGKPRILPKIEFTKIVDDRYAYTFGFPESNLTYNHNERNSFISEFILEGTYANLINYMAVGDNASLSHIDYSVLTFGIKYVHKLDVNWSFYLKAGGVIHNNYRLLSSDKINIEMFRSPFISTGVKFNLK